MNNRVYFIDLTTTDACNLNCSYCFEHGIESAKRFAKQDYDLLFSKLRELLESNFIKSNYGSIGLNFWGGEPTLNSDFIRATFNEFKNEDRIKFMMYTNGFDCSSVFNLIDSVKNKLPFGQPKFMTQISYDGLPVHDICRKSKDGKLNSHIVRNTILEFDKGGLPYMIKSTITPETLKYLHLCYQDIFDIYRSLPHRKWRNDNYFPTVDLYHFDNYKDEELDLFEENCKESLIKLSKLELDYLKTSGRYFFSWFTGNKAICSAGADTSCMDFDGKIYKCHGCLYQEEKNEHFITSFKENDFVNKLEESHKYHKSILNRIPNSCINCTVPFCLRCNAAKYPDSKEKDYGNRWTDYGIHKRLCSIFKINEKIIMALNQINKLA